jgi:hypothetical protein
MGPVNWIAVALAAVVALAIGLIWNRTMFRSGRQILPGHGRRTGHYGVILVVMLLAAIMLGHNFARIGSATLDVKPWLYFMMSGGLALFFTVPAVWLTHARNGGEPMKRITDCAFWLIAYLAMGAVFWAFG